VYTYFHQDGRDYMVMDFVPGRSLAEVLAERASAGQPPLDESVVIGYAIQICRALEYLHSRDPHPVIHRDIKPENIRITPHGELKLVDFGLLKRLDATNPSTLAFAQGLTPVYASPEQWGLLSDTHTDPRSDIYSLAATLYHMLTGQSPMSALNRVTGSRGKFRTDDPLIRPRQINPAVSARAEKAILRALAYQPDERYATAREFRAALSVGTDTLQARRR
jgi:serine/threonine-protein kinase